MRSEIALFAIGLGVALLSGERVAIADEIHAFGPTGSAKQRRTLVVVEKADGTCASWDDLALAATSPHTRVELHERVGQCARWVTIRTDQAQGSVALSAHGEGVAAKAAVALGSNIRLQVRAHRRGSTLRVSVAGAHREEDVRVVAFWSGSRSKELLREPNGSFAGRVPRREPIGVVARSGTLSGAGLVGGVKHGSTPTVVVMPSNFAIPAGGAARTAAFLMVADRRGRPSRNVPLRIQSQQGELQGLQWLDAGLAALDLSAPASAESIDLQVHVGGSQRRVQLPVTASWPATASIEAPEQAVQGKPFAVAFAATDLEGTAVADDKLRARCGRGAVPVAAGSLRCEKAGPGSVVVSAQVDGRWVPLAWRSISVRPVPRAVARGRPPPAAAAPPPPALSLIAGALLHGGRDTWSRTPWGAGLRLELEPTRVAPALRFDLTARYTLAPYRAQGAPDLFGGGGLLDSTRYCLDVLSGASVGYHRFGAAELFLGVQAGAAWVRDAGRLEGNPTELSGWRVILQAATGTRVGLGPAELSVALGARLSTMGEGSWSEAPARVFLEVGGAARL
ncbi:MAG: hypothetical protein MJD61_12760 [Proteobacteria bacterium]|nr:hypothetical protein [Pseudomonadota bacterium]